MTKRSKRIKKAVAGRQYVGLLTMSLNAAKETNKTNKINRGKTSPAFKTTIKSMGTTM